MIPPELEAKILRLYQAESWKIGQIARELGVHHSVVRRVIASSGVSEGLYFVRPSMLDPYVQLIVETLDKHPRLPVLPINPSSLSMLSLQPIGSTIAVMISTLLRTLISALSKPPKAGP